jgi:hypothetical protein
VTDIFIRNLDDSVRADMKRAAAVRGITLAEYLKRLVEMHQRGIVRAGHHGVIGNLLDDVGLSEVSA